MPLYEFQCVQCGQFELRRPISEASAPAHCPHCQAPAQRLFSAPNLARLASTKRQLLDRAERGSEPRLERRTAPDPQSSAAEPHHGHSHGRPWMLGHS